MERYLFITAFAVACLSAARRLRGGTRVWLWLIVTLGLAPACRSASGPASAGLYDPSRDLGALFQDVQVARLFPDSKTFVDARPLLAPVDITARYDAARTSGSLDLRAFVGQNFEAPQPVGAGVRTDPSQTMEEHIRALWPAPTRAPDTAGAWSSLIPLPHAYVVPGGRFREVYYWDSYFTLRQTPAR